MGTQATPEDATSASEVWEVAAPPSALALDALLFFFAAMLITASAFCLLLAAPLVQS